jgi:hypothetical protein
VQTFFLVWGCLSFEVNAIQVNVAVHLLMCIVTIVASVINYYSENVGLIEKILALVSILRVSPNSCLNLILN